MKRWRLLLLLGGMAFCGAALAARARPPNPTLQTGTGPSGAAGPGGRHDGGPMAIPQRLAAELLLAAGQGDGRWSLPSRSSRRPSRRTGRSTWRNIRSAAWRRWASQKFGFVLDQKDEKSKGYDRLYFDRNGNGDLTDDQPIDAASTKQLPLIVASYAAEPFSPRGPEHRRGRQEAELLLLLRADHLRLGGRPIRLGVVDGGRVPAGGNHPGREEMEGRAAGPQQQRPLRRPDVAPRERPGRRTANSIPTTATCCCWTRRNPPLPGRGAGRLPASPSSISGKINGLDGKLYEFKVSPRGDELTVTPSAVPLGKIASPHAPCTLELIGQQGYLSLDLEKSGAAEVPAGQWRLLSYTLTVENWQPPAKEEDQEKRRPRRRTPRRRRGTKEARPAVVALEGPAGDALLGPSLDLAGPLYGPATTSQLSAQGTVNGKPITVEAGKTTTLKFGPPYKAAAKLAYVQRGAGRAFAGHHRRRRRGRLEPVHQRASPPETQDQDHRPRRQSRRRGRLRVWLRLHLPVLVASTFQVGRPVSSPRPAWTPGRLPPRSRNRPSSARPTSAGPRALRCRNDRPAGGSIESYIVNAGWQLHCHPNSGGCGIEQLPHERGFFGKLGPNTCRQDRPGTPLSRYFGRGVGGEGLGETHKRKYSFSHSRPSP